MLEVKKFVTMVNFVMFYYHLSFQIKDGEKKYDRRPILKREKQTTRKLLNIENAQQESGAVCAI